MEFIIIIFLHISFIDAFLPPYHKLIHLYSVSSVLRLGVFQFHCLLHLKESLACCVFIWTSRPSESSGTSSPFPTDMCSHLRHNRSNTGLKLSFADFVADFAKPTGWHESVIAFMKARHKGSVHLQIRFVYLWLHLLSNEF